MKKYLLVFVVILSLLCIFPSAAYAAPVNYPNVTLNGGFQAGHFDDLWDLTAGDITISFTYDGNGLVDDAGTHAWAELGIRSFKEGASDFNPYWSFWTFQGQSKTVDLLAGKNTDVGDVTIWSDGINLYVKYETISNWFLTETHVHAASFINDIPQTNKGNPIPGQFAQGELYNPPQSEDTFTFNLDDIGWSPNADTPLYVAAHAVVAMIDTFSDCLISGAGSDSVLFLEEDSLNPGYPLGYTGPYQSYTGTPVSSVLAWTHSAWGPYGIAGAEWISSSYYTENTDYNTWRLFTRAFTLPSDALNVSSTLTINCDNAEDVYLNGVKVGDGSPAIVYGASVKDVSPPSGIQHGWNTVEGPWDVSTYLNSGNNELWIMTRNYAWSGGPTANPTGLIYKLCYSYDIVTKTETAWADGTGFPGKNWATYITLDPVEVDGAGVWLATDYDWTPNTFDPDVTPSLDLDDKLILQRQGGQGEGAYNLPSTPPVPGNNHRFWWDRDGVDPWQNAETANTGGVYQILITLHATSATTGSAYMNIRGLDQGFETDGNWNTIELTPAGMTFTADMQHLQIFFGLYGYGAVHSVSFSNITITQ